MDRFFFVAIDDSGYIYGLFASRKAAKAYLVPNPTKPWYGDIHQETYECDDGKLFYVELAQVKDI